MAISHNSYLYRAHRAVIFAIAQLSCYYYYTRFEHVKSFTKVKNLKCERSQCHRRNARLYIAVLKPRLESSNAITVITEVTVSENLFQTAGAA